MKKLVLSALFLCGSAAMIAQTTTTTDTYGQNTYGVTQDPNSMGRSTFGIGVKGGVNFASFSGDGYNAFDNSGRTSFNAGVVAELPVAMNFAIQPEIMYSGQGFKFKNTGSGDVSLDLDYINIPVLAKYYFLDGFYAVAGPQLGFNINSKIKNNADFGNVSGDSQRNLDDSNFKDLEFGINVGLGYKLPSGFFVDARYIIGLTDVYDNGNLPVNLDAKNAVFQASIGYMFL